ncbi:MAG: DUF6046 domain-containing protein [Bacteroides sp.]|nr:DUF6046 domain-containing protein [Bacteroides sp.]
MAKKVIYEWKDLIARNNSGAISSQAADLGSSLVSEYQTFTNIADAEDVWKIYSMLGIVRSVMPLRLKSSSEKEWFTLPMEPMVSITGKNVIVRRNVAKSNRDKGKGSVKERWSQDDYEIVIQGLVSERNQKKYPNDYVNRLLELFDQHQAVEVEHDILTLFGITHLSLESISFPHTKGMNNQNFEIKAYSDTSVELLIKV